MGHGWETPEDFSESYATKTGGAGKTLIPAGIVNDSNGGNNYTCTFANSTAGVITAKGLTVSGVTASSKVYDGTLTATVGAAGAPLHRALGPVHPLRQGDFRVQRNAGPVEPGRPPERRTSNVGP
jgi:hypothetical protein